MSRQRCRGLAALLLLAGCAVTPATPAVSQAPAPTAAVEPAATQAPETAAACTREEVFVVGATRVFSVAGERAVFYEAGMAIDADGAPRAYHPDGTSGLDFLANAGAPGNWFGVVTDNGRKDGNPVVQGEGDPAPGFFVSPTSLQDGQRATRDPRRYVDASTVPYIALPARFRDAGVHLGDMAFVLDRRTSKSSAAIFADGGPAGKLGEASIALAEALGVPSSPKHGGKTSGIAYLVFPGSGNGKPRSLDEIQATTNGLLSAFGGVQRLERCLEE